MSKYKKILENALKLEKNEKPYAIATVINVTGSSSGRVGDKAIFDEKGQRIMGYIGGGCIENTVSDTAIAEEAVSPANVNLQAVAIDDGLTTLSCS